MGRSTSLPFTSSKRLLSGNSRNSSGVYRVLVNISFMAASSNAPGAFMCPDSTPPNPLSQGRRKVQQGSRNLGKNFRYVDGPGGPSGQNAAEKGSGGADH